jgi:16S rRNA (uracil1498-N3)-methyltransferase
MPYFLSKKNLALNQEAQISGEEAAHILLSHRVKVGEKIKLQGPDGKRFLAEVVKASKKDVAVKVLESLVVPAEPAVEIVLFQAAVSEKALDFIFQKGTELGLSKIVLFNSANVSAKLSKEQFAKKSGRWNKILNEAAKQSERAKAPALEFADDIFQLLAGFDKVILADISGSPIKNLKILTSCAVIIGPEGGFTAAEIQEFEALNNMQTVSLGPILLRAETAALAIVAIIRSWAI